MFQVILVSIVVHAFAHRNQQQHDRQQQECPEHPFCNQVACFQYSFLHQPHRPECLRIEIAPAAWRHTGQQFGMLGGQQAAADRFFKRHAVHLHSVPGGCDVVLRESTAHHGLGRIEYLKMAGSVPGQHFSQRTETNADLIPRLSIKKQQRTPRMTDPGHFPVCDHGYQRDEHRHRLWFPRRSTRCSA